MDHHFNISLAPNTSLKPLHRTHTTAMSVVPVLPSNDPAPATRFTTADGLQISPSLDAFIKSSLPASISPENFYFCLNDLVVNIEPRIRTALKTRDEIQSQIDDYHRKTPGPIDAAKYEVRKSSSYKERAMTARSVSARSQIDLFYVVLSSRSTSFTSATKRTYRRFASLLVVFSIHH